MASGYVDKRAGPRGVSWFYRCDLDPGPGGKRRQTTKRGFPTKRAAQEALNTLLHTVQGGGVTPARLLVGELFDRWLSDWIKPNRRITTYEAYESCVRVHLKPRFGALQLAKLSPLAIQHWLAEQQAAGLSSATIASQRAILSSALQQAVYWGLLQSNPVARVRGAGAHSAERPVLTAEQFAALIQAVEGHELEVPILMALTLGLRRGEIAGLMWSDLDLEKGTLRVARGLVRSRDGLKFQPPKTRQSARPLPLGPYLTERLRQHHEEQAAAQQGHDLLFPEADGGPRNPNWLTDGYREIARELELPGTFHDLRHVHTSHLLAEGVDLKVVSARLGHATVAITADRYAHLLPGQQEGATDAAERVMKRARERGRNGASGDRL